MTLSTAERPARGCSVRRKGSETARRARRKAPITRSPNEPELSDAVGSILRGPYPASCMGAGRESYTLGLNEAALYREGDYKMSWPWIQIPGYRCAVGVVRAGFTPGPLLRLCVHPANEALSERRRRDSNPRYPVERYNTLAGCRLQPLGHSSRAREYIKDGRRLRASAYSSSDLLSFSIVSSSTTSGFSFAGSASRIRSPETSSFILTSVALRVAPKRMVREEM